AWVQSVTSATWPACCSTVTFILRRANTPPAATARTLPHQCHPASTQTDAMRAPAPRRRQMKNKSVLCRPFTTDQEIMCQLPSSSPESKGGIVPSRVEESYLWECKQLGAYSPIVLLHTLLFFCTKNLHLTTLAEHQHLSFSNFTRRFKPFSAAGNVCYLQYERSRRETSDSEQKGDASPSFGFIEI
ncbi:hypothetical protein XENOCAPTIV_004067, partial [Xenoophorus captivus]